MTEWIATVAFWKLALLGLLAGLIVGMIILDVLIAHGTLS